MLPQLAVAAALALSVHANNHPALPPRVITHHKNTTDCMRVHMDCPPLRSSRLHGHACWSANMRCLNQSSLPVFVDTNAPIAIRDNHAAVKAHIEAQWVRVHDLLPDNVSAAMHAGVFNLYDPGASSVLHFAKLPQYDHIMPVHKENSTFVAPDDRIMAFQSEWHQLLINATIRAHLNHGQKMRLDLSHAHAHKDINATSAQHPKYYPPILRTGPKMRPRPSNAIAKNAKNDVNDTSEQPQPYGNLRSLPNILPRSSDATSHEDVNATSERTTTNVFDGPRFYNVTFGEPVCINCNIASKHERNGRGGIHHPKVRPADTLSLSQSVHGPPLRTSRDLVHKRSPSSAAETLRTLSVFTVTLPDDNSCGATGRPTVTTTVVHTISDPAEKLRAQPTTTVASSDEHKTSREHKSSVHQSSAATTTTNRASSKEISHSSMHAHASSSAAKKSHTRSTAQTRSSELCTKHCADAGAAAHTKSVSAKPSVSSQSSAPVPVAPSMSPSGDHNTSTHHRATVTTTTTQASSKEISHSPMHTHASSSAAKKSHKRSTTQISSSELCTKHCADVGAAAHTKSVSAKPSGSSQSSAPVPVAPSVSTSGDHNTSVHHRSTVTTTTTQTNSKQACTKHCANPAARSSSATAKHSSSEAASATPTSHPHSKSTSTITKTLTSTIKTGTRASASASSSTSAAGPSSNSAASSSISAAAHAPSHASTVRSSSSVHMASSTAHTAHTASTVAPPPAVKPTSERTHPLFSNDAPAVAVVPAESLLGLLMALVCGIVLF